MHVRIFRRRLLGTMATGVALVLAACGAADNPYANFRDAPLVQGRLHTVTLASDSPAIAAAAVTAGWQPAELRPNYQQADAVQASIWGVPEPVAAAVRHFVHGRDGTPDLRLLVMPLAAKGRVAEPDVDRAFFRNVLGADVPRWPLPGAQPANVRVQVWTYLVPDIVEASKRLRSNGIPVVYDPVGITTSYLGDHRTLAIRAPDGTVVQLVQTAAR